MMKRRICFVAALLLILSGCASKEEVLPVFVNIAVHQEFLEDGVVTGTDDYFHTYNEDGLAVYSERHQDGSLLYKTSREYDEYGNPARIITEGNGATEVTEYKTTLDDAGRILRQEMYMDGKLCSVDEYTYDKKGNELTHEYEMFSEMEEMSDWRIYTKTYDRKGELIRETLHWNFNDEYTVWDYKDELCVRQTYYESETDKITEYWIYTYDEKGNQVRTSHYDGEDNLSDYNEFTWDDTGLVKTEMSYHADGTPRDHSDIFTYDEYGNQIMQERCIDGEVYWRITYIYEMLEPMK